MIPVMQLYQQSFEVKTSSVNFAFKILGSRVWGHASNASYIFFHKNNCNCFQITVYAPNDSVEDKPKRSRSNGGGGHTAIPYIRHRGDNIYEKES